jgi:hypothetical protein
MLIMASVAPSILVSSKGLDTAALAASTALFHQQLHHIPIKALPLFSIIALTSAKSKLIRHGKAIKSLMDITPRSNTLSALRKHQ